jgi:adenosylcobinamide-GDP ribazoletransferase
VVTARSASAGLGSSYAALAPRWRGVVAAVVGTSIATVCVGVAGPVSLIAAVVGALLVARWADRALGGVNGDVLGAIEQLGEIGTLLVSVALIGRGFGLPLV